MSSVYRTLANSYGIDWRGEERPSSPDYFVVFENMDRDRLHKMIDNMRKNQFCLVAGHFMDFYWICYADKPEEC